MAVSDNATENVRRKEEDDESDCEEDQGVLPTPRSGHDKDDIHPPAQMAEKRLMKALKKSSRLHDFIYSRLAH